MVSLWQFTVELCSLLCLPSTSSWPCSNPALPTMMLNRSDVCGACVVSWQTWSFWVLQAHDHITSHIPCTDGPTHTQAGRQAGRQCNCWNGCRPSAPEKAKERVTPQLSSTAESPPPRYDNARKQLGAASLLRYSDVPPLHGMKYLSLSFQWLISEKEKPDWRGFNYL